MPLPIEIQPKITKIGTKTETQANFGVDFDILILCIKDQFSTYALTHYGVKLSCYSTLSNKAK